MLDYVLWSLLGCGILFVLILLWFVIHYWLNPSVENPDGEARITGRCGDTMELCLKFRNDRVVETSHWTDGCAYSLNCAWIAADLAKGKTPDEIIEIDADRIQASIGGLPKDQIHCAELAAETLQAALDDYMKRRQKQKVGA
jgi:nitrogen fixation NifU-like protein